MKKYIINWSIIGLFVGSILALWFSSKGFCEYRYEYIPGKWECEFTLINSAIQHTYFYLFILKSILIGLIIGLIHGKIMNRKKIFIQSLL